MPSCILHVLGKSFDPHLALAGSTLRAYSIFRCGEHFSRNRRHESSGFKCLVSDGDENFVQQVKDAIAFLKSNEIELRRISTSAGLESMTLDFGHNLRIDGKQCAIQCDTLPLELLKLCGSIGIAIELSLYPAPNGRV
jgi:hypothetical protein